MNKRNRHKAKLVNDHEGKNVIAANVPTKSRRQSGPVAIFRIGAWQWRKGIHNFFDRSEHKVGEAHHWLQQHLDRIRAVESKAEEALDTSLAIAMVAKMDIKRIVQDYKTRSERFKSKVTIVRNRPDESQIDHEKDRDVNGGVAL